MTLPDQIVDPQQAAFWARDPNVLREPDPFAGPAETEPEQTHRLRLALEISAAFLVCARLARAHLAAQHDPGDPAKAGEKAWGGVSGVFTGLTATAMVQALRMDPATSSLSSVELSTLANTYVTGLAGYLGKSSVTAFVAAIDKQLAAKWSERVAYSRAAAVFGVESAAIGPFLAKAAAVVDQEIVTPAAQAIADAALLARAELIGDTESRTATENAKTIYWREQLAAGALPATARRRWVTARFEDDCSICGGLDRQEVELDQPFVVEGYEIWSPQAHPNCKCHVELVHAEVAKAYNPNERRGQPGNRGQWVATPVAERLANPLDELEVAPDAPAKEKASPFAAPATPSPFAGSPFSHRSDGPSPFAQAAAPSGKLAGPSGKLGPAASGRLRAEASGKLGRPKIRVNRRHVALLPPPPAPKLDHRPYYMATDMYQAEVDPYRVGEMLDNFTDIDFDLAHPTHFGTLNAEARDDPWDALPYDLRTQGRVATRDGIPITNPADLSAWWYDTTPDLARGWEWAIMHADNTWGPGGDLVEQLYPEDRENIALMAGRNNWHGHDDLIEQIKGAVANMDNGDEDDDSLAQAYGDYVTYFRPDLLGTQGDVISEKLLHGQVAYGVDMTDRPVNQVLSFQRGFHPETRRDRESVDPHGRYTVVNLAYRSALHDHGGTPPPLTLGLQLAEVQPMAKFHESPMKRSHPRDLG